MKNQNEENEHAFMGSEEEDKEPHILMMKIKNQKEESE